MLSDRGTLLTEGVPGFFVGSYLYYLFFLPRLPLPVSAALR